MKTIQEIAKQFGITTTTLRHYEQLGLLDERHVVRGANGYRQFTEAAEVRLELIRHGKTAGFSLRELADNIQRWEDDTFTEAEKRTLFHDQLARVETKIHELEATKKYLAQKLKYL